MLCPTKEPCPNLIGQGHTCSETIPVRAVILLCMEAFKNNLAQMYGISRWCDTRKIHTPVVSQSSRSHLQLIIMLKSNHSCPGSNSLIHEMNLK